MRNPLCNSILTEAVFSLLFRSETRIQLLRHSFVVVVFIDTTICA